MAMNHANEIEDLGIACIFAKSRRYGGILNGRLVVVDRHGEPYLKIFRVGINKIGWDRAELLAP